MISSQLYLLVFMLVFFSVVFLFRSYLLWKQTGINPMTFDTSADDAHSFNGVIFKGLIFLELGLVLCFAFGGNWSQYLLPFWYLDNHYLQIVGWILLHFSLIWIFIAQIQMANSWRIGIDYENKTELITTGLFRYSRNPIFLGIIIADLGVLFIMPNAFTLLVVSLSVYSVQIQVRLEEIFLKENHGQYYLEYLENVSRWI